MILEFLLIFKLIFTSFQLFFISILRQLKNAATQELIVSITLRQKTISSFSRAIFQFALLITVFEPGILVFWLNLFKIFSHFSKQHSESK